MIINGPFAHEWFKDNIEKIIENYLKVSPVQIVDRTKMLNDINETERYCGGEHLQTFDSREFGYTQPVYKDIREEIDETIARVNNATLCEYVSYN